MKRVLSALLLLLIVIVGTVSADESGKVIPYISVNSFCRKYEAANNTVYINYELQNNTSAPLELQLATTLDVQGQPRNLLITYTNCVWDGISCFYRIDKDYNYVMNANEKAVFSGEVKLDTVPSINYFSVYSSLVYKANGSTNALSLGKTTKVCPAAPSQAPVSKEITALALCRDYSKGTDLLVRTPQRDRKTDRSAAGDNTGRCRAGTSAHHQELHRLSKRQRFLPCKNI